ncbi:MAG: class I SAM-dependent methyltransferase [Pleurocapsa sp. MO_192.B19]|nr:class I SAM-dependent methyltransferase [Pleurocapsa sp. MO_192.B19]
MALKISEEVYRGQAVYSKLILAIYDLWVLGISNKFIWRCPTAIQLEHFNKNVTSNHLDIGVGTGYFLEHCRFPTESVRLGLMDLNQNSLEVTGKRLSKYNPETYKFNVLDAVDLDIEPFDSISLNYLFHCLPGSFPGKLIVLDNIDRLLRDKGILFGATILQQDVVKSYLANKLMDIYNQKGIFCNTQDKLGELDRFLSQKYSSYEISTEGCVALFRAVK